MAGDTESKSGARTPPYAPYGALYGGPYGLPFARAYGWPYLPRPLPFSPYGAPFSGIYSPWGVPYSEKAARKQELDALKAQAEYFEGVLKDIRARIAELEGESGQEG